VANPEARPQAGFLSHCIAGPDLIPDQNAQAQATANPAPTLLQAAKFYLACINNKPQNIITRTPVQMIRCSYDYITQQHLEVFHEKPHLSQYVIGKQHAPGQPCQRRFTQDPGAHAG
jgi:hypothetical protein